MRKHGEMALELAMQLPIPIEKGDYLMKWDQNSYYILEPFLIFASTLTLSY